MLDHADAFEDYFDHVAVFHYGHGTMNMSSQLHRGYYDNDAENFTDPDHTIWD